MYSGAGIMPLSTLVLSAQIAPNKNCFSSFEYSPSFFLALSSIALLYKSYTFLSGSPYLAVHSPMSCGSWVFSPSSFSFSVEILSSVTGSVLKSFSASTFPALSNALSSTSSAACSMSPPMTLFSFSFSLSFSSSSFFCSSSAFSCSFSFCSASFIFFSVSVSFLLCSASAFLFSLLKSDSLFSLFVSSLMSLLVSLNTISFAMILDCSTMSLAHSWRDSDFFARILIFSKIAFSLSLRALSPVRKSTPFRLSALFSVLFVLAPSALKFKSDAKLCTDFSSSTWSSFIFIATFTQESMYVLMYSMHIFLMSDTLFGYLMEIILKYPFTLGDFFT